MNPTSLWNKLTAVAPKRATAQLVSRTETFTLRPGRLTADLDLTPQRENELLARKAKIEKDEAAIVSGAMKTYDRLVREGAAVRDNVIEEANRNARKALRRLYVEYTEIDDEETAARAVGAAKNPAVMNVIASTQTAANGAAPTRRRIQSVPAKPVEDAAGVGGIPDKLEEVIKEQAGHTTTTLV